MCNGAADNVVMWLASTLGLEDSFSCNGCTVNMKFNFYKVHN